MKGLAVAALIALCAGCFWISSTILTVATASCCSGGSLWASAPPATKLLIAGLVLWHAAGTVASGLAALVVATRRSRP